MYQLFLVSGYKGHGKDHFFRVLQGEEPWTYNEDYFTTINLAYRFAFADPLKDLYCRLTGITREELETNEEMYRKGLFSLSRKARKKDDDVFTREIGSAIEDLFKIPHPTTAVITDFRQMSEYNHIMARFRNRCVIKTVRIVSLTAPTPDDSVHLEHELDDFEFDYIFTH